MNIAIDGGALNANTIHHYGNFTFTGELINALSRVDGINSYTLYTYEPYNSLRLPENFRIKCLIPKKGWMKLRVSLEELKNKSDIFLALNQSLPVHTRAKIISFSHGLSFMKFPALYPDSYTKMKRQVEEMLKRSSHTVVSSQKVEKDFDSYFGDNKNIHVIPFGIPSMFRQNSLRYKRKKIILYVGMNHPIKQLDYITESFNKLTRDKKYGTYLLLLVGVEKKYSQKNILTIPHATHVELLKFYNEAACLLSASLYESFNLPILEALSQETPVVALSRAVIPELKNYVYTCAQKKDFVTIIKKALIQPKKINLSKLREQFSWDNFAARLIGLY